MMTKVINNIQLTKAKYEVIKEKALKRAIDFSGKLFLEKYNEKLLELVEPFQKLKVLLKLHYGLQRFYHDLEIPHKHYHIFLI